MNRVSTFAERLKEYMKMHNDMSYAMLAKITVKKFLLLC